MSVYNIRTAARFFMVILVGLAIQGCIDRRESPGEVYGLFDTRAVSCWRVKLPPGQSYHSFRITKTTMTCTVDREADSMDVMLWPEKNAWEELGTATVWSSNGPPDEDAEQFCTILISVIDPEYLRDVYTRLDEEHINAGLLLTFSNQETNPQGRSERNTMLTVDGRVFRDLVTNHQKEEPHSMPRKGERLELATLYTQSHKVLYRHILSIEPLQE